MQTSPLTLLRLLVVSGMFVFMPILAMPAVGKWLDHLLWGLENDEYTPVAVKRFPAKPIPPNPIPAKPIPANSKFERNPPIEGLSPPTPSSNHYHAPQQFTSLSKPVKKPHLHTYSNDPKYFNLTTRPDGGRERHPNTDQDLQNARIHAIKRRLQQWGASYMVLESSGENGRQFRFHCRMPLAGKSVYSRPFDAVDVDPVAAMERVLQAVETWRTPDGELAREGAGKIETASRSSSSSQPPRR